MKRWACIALLGCFSCQYFTPEAKPEAVARVNDSYLYKDELKNLVPGGTAAADSVLIVRNFIDRWAAQKLLIGRAEVNLPETQKAELDELVKQYKIDLYTKAYLEEIVRQTVDTAISEAALRDYYQANKENFRTGGMLVRLRYIRLDKDNPRYEAIKNKFFDYRKSDQKFWDTYALQFKSFAFNDSVWVDMNQVYSKLPFIHPDNRDQYMVAGKSIQYEDSLGSYLVKVRGVIDRNQVSPYEYVKPTLKEVLLNKRKLELIKKFEKEITDDAIKDKNYEIYK